MRPLQQEREERIQRMRRQHPDDRPSHAYQPIQQRDVGYQVKRQRPNSRLPPGELLAHIFFMYFFWGAAAK